MCINIIVAFSSQNFGIGNKGSLPWNIAEDMARFYKLTKGSVVVMGRKTWDSIPEERRPLKDRVNVVVTSNTTLQDKGVLFVQEKDLDNLLKNYNNVFIIGGRSLYAKYMGVAKRIFATLVDSNTECDTFFPLEGFHNYVIEEVSSLNISNGISFRYVNYVFNPVKNENVYLDLLSHIMQHGLEREDRTGTGTYSIFAPQMRFDITKSLPLLTTKFVGYKTILKELLFFLKGQTDSKLLEEQGVSIWKANTTREFLDNRGLTSYRVGDMGPMYGFNWRHFGEHYEGCDKAYHSGYDQLSALIKGLKSDPYSRRHMITTFDPSAVERSVLAPCHGIVTQFYVTLDNDIKYLSCHVYCRSSDVFLGLPYNIASYAMLTYIIAKMCDMHPKELVISMGDCHIYKNHVEQVKQQMTMPPLPFPQFLVDDGVKDKTFDDLTLDDFQLIAYLHHPVIRAPMAV